MTHGKGLHHFHLRKRVHNNLEEYPNPDKVKKFVDKAIYFVGVSAPIMTIPQAIKIFAERNAGGISLISWIAYTFIALFWLWYGILHKEKPIILTNIAWFIIDIIVIIGTLIYR